MYKSYLVVQAVSDGVLWLSWDEEVGRHHTCSWVENSWTALLIHTIANQWTMLLVIKNKEHNVVDDGGCNDGLCWWYLDGSAGRRHAAHWFLARPRQLAQCGSLHVIRGWWCTFHLTPCHPRWQTFQWKWVLISLTDWRVACLHSSYNLAIREN